MSDLISREQAMSHPFANDRYDHENADEGFILGHESYKEWLETLPSAFQGMTNKEIISEFAERDDSFAIMVDEVNGTVNIELSLEFWRSPYKEACADACEVLS